MDIVFIDYDRHGALRSLVFSKVVSAFPLRDTRIQRSSLVFIAWALAVANRDITLYIRASKYAHIGRIPSDLETRHRDASPLLKTHEE